MSKELEIFINKIEDDFLQVRSNENLSFQQEAYFAVQILQSNNYVMNLARSNSTSLRNSIINIATIGLSLNPSLGLAYLIPRKNELCADISYLGLIKLAQDSGSIRDIKAEIVHEKDVFEISGAFNEPVHKYSPFGERGKMIGAYVVASTLEGNFLTTTMTLGEIMEIRDSSESYKNERTRKYSPWVKHESEMIKKTVIRRAYKLWPKTDKTKFLEKAILVSDHAQAIEFKSEYQLEKEQFDKDFPIPENEKVLGSPEYRIQNAKFRGKQLSEIDTDDLEDYIKTIEKRHEKHAPKTWELEVSNSIKTYIEDLEEEENSKYTD